MKILIQKSGSKLYFKSLDKWVKEERDAREFSNSLSALDFCLEHGLRGVEILLRFNDPKHDIRLCPFGEPSSGSGSGSRPPSRPP